MTLPKPRAVIFDWDDTVVDNWAVAVAAFNAALSAMGTEPWTEDVIRRRTGGSARDMFTALFGERWVEAEKVYYDTFLRLAADKTRPHDHIEDLFRLLDESGVYMAVVSNKRGTLLRQETMHTGFDKYFGKVVGSGDASADKPDPAPVHLALEGSGIAAGPHVWFIGDSHTDMQCAHNTGLTPILIETKPPPEDVLRPIPPARRFARHYDLMEFLNSCLV